MSDLKNILSQEDGEWNDENLFKYLQGDASEEERFAIENGMAGSDFMNDAVEGLQHFSDPQKAKAYAEQLNRQLHKQISAKKKRKRARSPKDQNWLLISIIVILLLCIMGYWVIRTIHQKQHTGNAAPTSLVVAKKIRCTLS